MGDCRHIAIVLILGLVVLVEQGLAKNLAPHATPTQNDYENPGASITEPPQEPAPPQRQVNSVPDTTKQIGSQIAPGEEQTSANIDKQNEAFNASLHQLTQGIEKSYGDAVVKRLENARRERKGQPSSVSALDYVTNEIYQRLRARSSFHQDRIIGIADILTAAPTTAVSSPKPQTKSPKRAGF